MVHLQEGNWSCWLIHGAVLLGLLIIQNPLYDCGRSVSTSRFNFLFLE